MTSVIIKNFNSCCHFGIFITPILFFFLFIKDYQSLQVIINKTKFKLKIIVESETKVISTYIYIKIFSFLNLFFKLCDFFFLNF